MKKLQLLGVSVALAGAAQVATAGEASRAMIGIDLLSMSPAVSAIDSTPVTLQNTAAPAPLPVVQSSIDNESGWLGYESARGRWEVLLSGSGSADNSFDAGGFNATGSLSYFFTPQLSAGVRQSAGYTDTGSDNQWTGATRVTADWHFVGSDAQRLLPFVGATFGFLYGNAFKDTLAAGPEAGLKWFVNDTTFIYGSVAYDFFFRNVGDVDDAFSDGQFVFGLGIGFRF